MSESSELHNSRELVKQNLEEEKPDSAITGVKQAQRRRKQTEFGNFGFDRSQRAS